MIKICNLLHVCFKLNKWPSCYVVCENHNQNVLHIEQGNDMNTYMHDNDRQETKDGEENNERIVVALDFFVK